MGAATASPSSTRERIQATFLQLVGERGYHATALADLAAAVGVSKGAILHYYENKEALLAEAGRDYMGRRDHELAHAFAHLDDPIEQLGAVVYSTMLAQRDDRAASLAFAKEFPLFQTVPGLAVVRERRERYELRVRTVIERCIRSKLIRDEDAKLVSLQIFGICNWSWTWYQPDGPLSAEELSARLLATLLAGLGPQSSTAVPEGAAERIVALIREAQTTHPTGQL